MATKHKSTIEPENHPLAHLIPGDWFAESYESRYFDGYRDIDILDAARKMRWNTLLYGPTGPGKTTSVYAYAAEKKLPVVYVACNGAVDPATLFVQPVTKSADVDEIFVLARRLANKLANGDPSIDAWDELGLDDQLRFIEVAAKITGEQIELQESDVVLVIRYGGILLLDEVNAIPPRIGMVMHGALDLRRTITVPQKGNEAIPLHPGTQVIGTLNPQYAGTKPLNQAFKNRFGIQLPYEYNRDIEEKLVQSIPSLLDLATMLRKAGDDGTLETPVGPNVLLEFEELAEAFSVDFAISNLVNRFEPEERAAVRETINTHFVDRINEDFDKWQKGGE